MIHSLSWGRVPVRRLACTMLAFLGATLTGCGGGADVGGRETRASASPASTIESAVSVASMVSAASDHACAVTGAGGAVCWGANEVGQLGNGITGSDSSLVQVAGLSSGIAAVSAGNKHSCALTSSGGVKCWGGNANGELGNGTGLSSAVPVDVSGLNSGVLAISAGDSHTCAVTSAGAAKCWGRNDGGQLGSGGGTLASATPVDVVDLASGVAAIDAGFAHTCAVTHGGGVKCWGNNQTGALGNGTFLTSYTPVDVTGLANGITAVSAGAQHTCALNTAGGIQCWGYNIGSQLGDGTTLPRSVPVDVQGMQSGATAVSAGSLQTCARTSAGGVKCWGSNTYGQLGDGGTAYSAVPVDVSGLAAGVSAISAGSAFGCALTTAGAAKCWGANGRGQAGALPRADAAIAVAPTDLTTSISAISTGGEHTCALTAAGGIKCWGSNAGGWLGNGTIGLQSGPVDVSGLTSGAADVSTGDVHTCALTNAGGVKCWGLNFFGQLGNGTNVQSMAPVDVVGLTSGVTAITTGSRHTCALTTAGAVKCWGYNMLGQLGGGWGPDAWAPVDVFGLDSGVAAISAGATHTCALTTSGAVKCWGYNINGQLGSGTTTSSPTPVDVFGLTSGANAISAGGAHTCAVTSGGAVKCWGYNLDGQLGNGTFINALSPADVSGLTSGIARVSTARTHTCALTVGGSVSCWGDNTAGRLGNGTYTGSATPVTVTGLASGVSALSTKYAHACAVVGDASVRCWGANSAAQLGIDPLFAAYTPIEVSGFNAADAAPPTATPVVSAGTAGALGWYRSGVSVSWNWVDGGSGIDTPTCPSASVSTGEGSALVVSATCKDLAGNTGSAAFTLKVDMTAPVTSITSAAPSSTTSSNATFSFDVLDSGSGTARTECSLDGSAFATCTSPRNYTALSVGAHVFTVRAVDNAGNVEAIAASQSWSVQAPDSTPPSITPQVAGTLGNNGWYQGTVSVSWSVVDNESALTGQSGCGVQNVAVDTSGVTYSCTAASGGGSTSRSVTIKRDSTPPNIALTSRTPPNAGGWNNTNVFVSWSCSDTGSGVIGQTVTQTLTSEGQNQSASGSCTDVAGNTVSNTLPAIHIDKTAPTLGVALGRTPVLQYLTLDVVATNVADGAGGSGVATSACAVAATSVIGSRTVSCTASDRAGNVGNASAAYSVISASTAITNLSSQVTSLRLDKNVERALLAKLQLAQGDLAATRKSAAIQNMNEFIALVNSHRGRKISNTNADALIANAQLIVASISASP